MKPITASRNKREGRYAGRTRYSRKTGRDDGPSRHTRQGPFRVNPHAWHCDSWSC